MSFLATVTFPNQQAIADYLSKHPCKPSIDLQPNSLQKVATYFAGKQMSLDQIKGNVETALADADTDANPGQKKLADLGTSLQALVAACEKIDKASEIPDTHFTDEMRALQLRTQQKSPFFVALVAVFDRALQDLLDQATFTPPPEGQTSWVRHVPQ